MSTIPHANADDLRAIAVGDKAPMMRCVVLASGGGSNFEALVEASQGETGFSVVGLVSDVPTAPVLDRAARLKIPSVVVPRDGAKANRLGFSRQVLQAAQAQRPELIVLAGFMRILHADALAACDAPLINLHPSLLPAFPGAHALRDALDHGVLVAGVTVHQVVPEVDAGPILGQAALEVHAGDTPASLLERLRPLEQRTLREVIGALARFHRQHGALPPVLRQACVKSAALASGSTR